jgi:UPF0755 protein
MKAVCAVLAAFFLVLLGLAAFGCWCWNDLASPVEVRQGLEVEIPTGCTPDETIARLGEAGIIQHTFPLKLYLKATHAGSRFKAGVYEFPSPVSPLSVLRILESGGKPFGRLTVIEGWTRWEIAEAMLEAGSLGLKNRGEALKLMNNCKSIRDLDGSAKNLEGYLFPDTYFFDSKTKAQDLIEQMVARFHQVWNEKLSKPAARAKISPHNLVTVASLIETEAKLKQERPLVASVVYNRIGRKMPLALDSSLVYTAKMAGAWKNDGKVYQSDIDRQSPYNTRQNTGLPPGPIGSPGLASMLAAVNPAQTDYIYYVRNPGRNDGAHNFYSGAAGFEKGVQALRNWERQQPKTVQPQASASAINPQSAGTKTSCQFSVIKNMFKAPGNKTKPLAPVGKPKIEATAQASKAKAPVADSKTKAKPAVKGSKARQKTSLSKTGTKRSPGKARTKPQGKRKPR